MAKKRGKLVAYIFCLFVMHTKPTKTWRGGGEIEMEGASVGVVSLSVSQCHVAT